jgi:hypothetical protein
MTTPNRQLIIEALRDRLKVIEVANGFTTDAGRALFLGETPELGEGDPDAAIAMVIREDDVRYQGMNLMIGLPVSIQALVKVSLDQPYLLIEALLGDIKRAVELEDRTLGGLVKRQIQRGVTRTMEREPGSTTAGVSILYVCPYTEVFGDP